MLSGASIARRSFFGAILLLTILTSACSKKESPSEHPDHSTPPPLLSKKVYDTARLFNGITLKSSLEGTPSQETSLHLEADPSSYQIQLELHLLVPKPATTSAEILAATPELGDLLPHLEALLEYSEPSPNFEALFAYKEKKLRANLETLQTLLPRDTLYDCQTILDLQNPETSRQAILIQALMNVNTDGSDGDRNLPIEKAALFFQPQTNYRWPKASKHPNPYLRTSVEQIADIQEKLLKDTSLSKTESSHLNDKLVEAKATIAELKRWSFLVGTADPFIVLPEFMFGKGSGHPQIGDYAIVIAKGILYPALVGDEGPNFKIGEASLRICREIDPKSTADSRPVDHPKVAYLVFPGTADKPFTSPNYIHWSDRCHALWKEFGGSDTASWQEWESLEKPWPTPTPSPTPTPTSSPDLILPPSPTASPDPSPSSAPYPGTGTNPAASISPLALSSTPEPTINSNTNPPVQINPSAGTN